MRLSHGPLIIHCIDAVAGRSARAGDEGGQVFAGPGCWLEGNPLLCSCKQVASVNHSTLGSGWIYAGQLCYCHFLFKLHIDWFGFGMAL
jgi:hypothetical protein